MTIAKNNPITKADEAVFKQDVQVVSEMLNDEIADISLKATWKDYRISFTSSGLTNEIGANAYEGNKSTYWQIPRTNDLEYNWRLSLPNNSGGRIVDITFSLYGYYSIIEIGFIDSNGNHISPYY